jgi:putative transposase
MKAELVTGTIKKAKKRWNLPKDCIHHSDLGSQYTAKETQKLLKELGFKQSFSRAGKPGDNAWSESFSPFLKKKLSTGSISKHVKKPAKRYSHILKVFITRVAYKNG